DRIEVLDLDGHVAVAVRVVAQLAVAVVPPAPRAAVGEPGAGRVLVTGVDLDGVLDPHDFHRHVARVVGAVPQLAAAVVSPALHPTLRNDGTRQVATGVDLRHPGRRVRGDGHGQGYGSQQSDDQRYDG